MFRLSADGNGKPGWDASRAVPHKPRGQVDACACAALRFVPTRQCLSRRLVRFILAEGCVYLQLLGTGELLIKRHCVTVQPVCGV